MSEDDGSFVRGYSLGASHKPFELRSCYVPSAVRKLNHQGDMRSNIKGNRRVNTRAANPNVAYAASLLPHLCSLVSKEHGYGTGYSEALAVTPFAVSRETQSSHSP